MRLNVRRRQLDVVLTPETTHAAAYRVGAVRSLPGPAAHHDHAASLRPVLAARLGDHL